MKEQHLWLDVSICIHKQLAFHLDGNWFKQIFLLSETELLSDP